jgi:hypothetical protein
LPLPNSEAPIRKFGSRPSNFGLLSDFGLRISDFDPAAICAYLRLSAASHGSKKEKGSFPG